MTTKQAVNRRRKSTARTRSCDVGDIVTQRELRMIKLLRTLDALHDELRGDIVERLKSGALVEQGPIVAKLTQQYSRRLTFDRLVEVVGNEEACSIRDAITPVPYSRLDIEDRRSRH